MLRLKALAFFFLFVKENNKENSNNIYNWHVYGERGFWLARFIQLTELAS